MEMDFTPAFINFHMLYMYSGFARIPRRLKSPRIHLHTPPNPTCSR